MAETPTPPPDAKMIAALVAMCRGHERLETDEGWTEEAKLWGWLADALPALLADRARLDLLDAYFDGLSWEHADPLHPVAAIRWFVGDGGGSDLTTRGETIREAVDAAVRAFEPDAAGAE